MKQFFVSMFALIMSISANAATYTYSAPVTGQAAPTKIGEFVLTSPSNYYSPSLYLDSSLSLGSLTDGDSVTKIFTISSPFALNNILGSVVTSGGSYASVYIACTPPSTLNSATPNEKCDILVTLNKDAAEDEDIWITIMGRADSTSYVESTFLLKSFYYDSYSSPLQIVPGANVNFDDTISGSQSAPFRFTLINQGSYVALENLTYLSDTSTFVVAGSTCSDRIEPLESCTVDVTFNPPSEGSFTGTFAAFANNSSNGTQSVLLSGVGTASSANLVNVSDIGDLNFNIIQGNSESFSLQFANQSSIASAGTYLAFTGDSILEAVSNTCGLQGSTVSINPAQNCTSHIAVSSLSVGDFEAFATLISENAPSVPVRVTAHVIAAESIAQVSPATITFPSRIQGQTNAVAGITVTNGGNSPLTLTGVSGLPASVSVTANSCTNVAPAETCTISFELSSASPVAFSNVTVTTVGATTNGTVTMSGTVVAASAYAAVSNGAINFGTLIYDAANANKVDRVISISNTGNVPLTVNNVSSLPTGVSFQSTTCSNIAPTGTCSLTVRLNSNGVTSFTNSALILEGPTAQDPISLTGSVIAPTSDVAIVSGAPVNFGANITGATAPTAVVTLINNGNSNLTLTDVTGRPASVSISANTCSNVAPNSTCTLTFSMSTASAVTFSNVVTTTVGSTANVSISMSGSVTSASSVATIVTGNPINFGSVLVGATSPSVSVTLRNTGTIAMTITGATPLPTGVTVSGNTCSNIAANATCILTFNMSTSAPTSFSNASVNTTGATTNAALTMTGTVTGAGYSAMATGELHSCGITAAGAAKCWGNNDYGQLGNGSYNSSLQPVQVTGLTSGVTSISVGSVHTCAVHNGAAKCWGASGSGYLGNGQTNTFAMTPVGVTGYSSGVASIVSSSTGSCLVTTAGKGACWGENGYYQLGDGTMTPRFSPVSPTEYASGIAQIAKSGLYTCARTTAGGAKCWGVNQVGEIGDGTQGTIRSRAVNVSGLTSGVTDISAGSGMTCAVHNGGLKCWGMLLDNEEVSNVTVPTAINSLSANVTKVSAGDFHVCVIQSGAAKCFGGNNYGQLGSGDPTEVVWTDPETGESFPSGAFFSTPRQVQGASTGVTALSNGGPVKSVCAVIGGAGACWGNNENGQLGDGTIVNRTVPVFLKP